MRSRAAGLETDSSIGLTWDELDARLASRRASPSGWEGIQMFLIKIKFEIIHERRINLDTPAPGGEICGLGILTRTDQVATKLLANDDRWADTSTFSRDLIDLAMMKPDTVALKAGARKAADAYGRTVGQSLNKAVGYLRDRPQRLDECIRALKIGAPRAAVWQRIRDLSARSAKIEALGLGRG